jgi:multiple sugar transport system ATP-binding protein
MANISLQHIVKVYPGGVTAVNDFNLDIDDGEFIVLVGPSGCGKSTALRMIAGLEEITGGELYIGDRLVNDVSPKDRDIAMVFQTYALYPHMTVYKNMAFSLELRKMPKDEIDERVRNAARILDIEHLLARKPKALSGGQRQRVALGRAMVRNPAVFLLDEPLSNLDAKLRASMRTELIKLHKSLGTTFVYVTHDQTEAMTMGDRIVVMKDGVVQQVDTPQNLYDKPCNVFVAGFIGSPQMNILKGVLHRNTDDAANADGKSYIQIGDDKILLPPEKCTNTLLAYASRDVLVGIRSEDIHDDEAFLSANPSSVVTATVDVSELMGSEVFLYLDYQGSPLTARVAPNTTSRIGDVIQIGFDTNKIHLFDAESELNIYSSPPTSFPGDCEAIGEP